MRVEDFFNAVRPTDPNGAELGQQRLAGKKVDVLGIVERRVRVAVGLPRG